MRRTELILLCIATGMVMVGALIIIAWAVVYR
jgi:hypothetical protein